MTSNNLEDKNGIVQLKNQVKELQKNNDTQAQLLYQCSRNLALKDRRINELEEINSKLVETKLHMVHLASHDFLTGLPNRGQLQERLKYAIALADRNDRKLAILFLDLDRFKSINDTLGHNFGDKVLECVAARLSRCVRSSDTLFRQGGDEFVILLSEIESDEDAFSLAEKITRTLAEPFFIDGQTEIHMTTSVGVSLFPKDSGDPEILIQHADTAMYHAKESGRNQYKAFCSDMNEKAMVKQRVELELRKALVSEEFFLVYQPKFHLHTKEVMGVEALLRWQHQRGTLWPTSFINTAEESGLIVKLSQFVMQKTFRCAKAWDDNGYNFGRLSINIANQDFLQGNFVKILKYELCQSGLHPSLLEIEITERVLLKDAGVAIDVLQQINSLGIAISIDDFGTGFSSLSYLKQLPIHILKIDSSFLRAIGANLKDGIILSAIINLGNSLNLDVIAEGIETEEQIEFLIKHNCIYGQGFNFSAPVSETEVTNFFRVRE